MDLTIEPLSAQNWPLYRGALEELKERVPLQLPPRGLLLTRVLAKDGKKRAVAGACLYDSGELATVAHVFCKKFSSDEVTQAVQQKLVEIGGMLSVVAYLEGRILLTIPYGEHAAGVAKLMGFTRPIGGLAR